MLRRSVGLASLCGALFLLMSDAAEAQLAQPGYSGLISTPNADVLPEGSLALSFSWVSGPDSYLRAPMPNRLYTVTAGLLPGLEVTMRLTEMVGWRDPTVPGVAYGNDRMVSAKYQLPRLGAWPRLAFGMQDIASANWLAGLVTNDPRQSYGHSMLYGVVGDTLGPWSWHIGGAHSRAFIKGVFGGASLQILPGFRVMAEYDGRLINWQGLLSPLPHLSIQVGQRGVSSWGIGTSLVLRL